MAENARRDHARATSNVENDEGNTLFIPIVLTSCGGFGPSARAFLKEVLKAAQANGRWAVASGQPDMLTTWNKFYAPTYWNMRWQPHPDPNSASYVLPGRPHRLAVALSRAA